MVGARVTLEAGGRTQTRFAKGGGSYASSPDRRLVFGLGQGDERGEAQRRLAGRIAQEWADILVDRYHVATQGQERLGPAIKK